MMPGESPWIPYLLSLADSNLIMSQRLSEWTGHGPALEQDIALTNLALDLLGQARLFYQLASELLGNTDEDRLAFLRTEREFKNLLLTELPNGTNGQRDWGHTVLKLFFFSQYHQLIYRHLTHHTHQQVNAIARKSLKETDYHLRWSSEWVIRLGDGTDESRQRMQHALTEIWPFTGEMFVPAGYESVADIELTGIQQQWTTAVVAVLSEARLRMPENTFMHTGGKTGTHTEYLGYILAEMQYMQRTYPNATW
jgi:ring-1,2-phenylacetyl-CoA epoxidase subunit PaaC